MTRLAILLKHILPLILCAFCAVSAHADEALDQLFKELAEPERTDWQRVEAEIELAWSKSGSPAMDLLLRRGQEAMAAGDFATAIEHLTALIDHDPDFPEGWNARATAYYQAGRFGESLSDIRETLRREPRHFGALFGFGLILEELEEPEKALEVYRAAEVIHPHMPALKEAIDRLVAKTEGAAL